MPYLPTRYFWLAALAVVVAIVFASRFVTNEYFFFAAYVVLQYVVMATAWNILGGYTGYVNFGTAGFFAMGAYTAVVLHKLVEPPLIVSILAGGLVAGAVGLGMGYLTLRLRGVFFAIATLALAIVLQTLITNWDYVGGSRGVYIIRPALGPFGHSYIQYLFSVMLLLAGFAICIARSIEHSKLGYGLATIRDDELAAEAAGVPTLKLKLIATTLSGGLMGMVGAPFPYYITYLDPSSGFNLAFAVNSIAMPLVGGTSSWIGPLLGAAFLGTIQQLLTVTNLGSFNLPAAVNLLVVGVVMVLFVVIAPNGIIGWFGVLKRRRA
jgi:branched-chain amino acid transport system permease protein